MKLVVDANVLFSALIKDSMTRRLFFEEGLELYAPEFLFEEFAKYKREIMEKTKRSEAEFEEMLIILRGRIAEIPSSGFGGSMKKALEISADKKDAAYFAVALALNAAIWSNDKRLKEQKVVRVLNTAEINEKATRGSL